MSALVPAAQIEEIVGAKRRPDEHLGRLVTSDRGPTMYILHSQSCVDHGADLRGCRYSLALDRTDRVDMWPRDVPVVLITIAGQLSWWVKVADQ